MQKYLASTESDVITFARKNTAANGANAITRYLAYSNVK